MSRLLRITSLSLCLVGLGCGASGLSATTSAELSSTTSPELFANPSQGRKAWVDALAGGDSIRIWALMGPEARARFEGHQQFHDWCKRRCADLLVLAVGMDGQSPEVEVLFERGLRVQMTAQGWRVFDPLFTETADQALQRLVMALGSVLVSRPLSALQAVASMGAKACHKIGPGQVTCQGPNGVAVHLKKQAGSWRLGGWTSPQ